MSQTTILQHPQEKVGQQHAQAKAGQPKWQRITLLAVLGYEALGCLSGGGLLVAAPDGRLMNMPVEIMHGVFSDFLIPGVLLLGLGILNAVAFVGVLRRTRSDWILAGLALGGLAVWFWVEIAILRELHWLHVMWGLPVVVGGLVAIPLVPARPTTLRKALLVCGVLSSLLYLATDLIGGVLYPGYSFTSQMISELMAIGAPSEAIVDPLFILYGLLTLAFGVGVVREAAGSRALRVTGGLLTGYALAGFTGPTLFEMHQRGTGSGATDLGHIVLTGVLVALTLLAIGFGAFALGKRFRVYSFATLLIMIVFGALAGSSGARLAAGQATPGFGIIERINVYTSLLWIAVLAIALLRRPRYGGAGTLP